MTVLVVASHHDLHADAVVDSLQNSADCIRIDPEVVAGFCCRSDSDVFSLGGHRIRIEDLTGIYCRIPLELPPYDAAANAVADYANSETLGALRGMLLAVPPDRWINFPWYENAADGKIRPLLVAQQVGCAVPPFIVTNDLDQLDLWMDKHGDDLVIKAITDTSIARQRDQFVTVPDYDAFSAPYTAKFDRTVLKPSNIDSTPFLVQKRIDKVVERRVVVLDRTIFATETPAGSDAPLDIRLKTERIEASSRLSESDCRAVLVLRERLNLRFMTLDFAVDAAGVSWLLDVNPQGNWLWQEQQLSLGIAAHLAAALVDGTPSQELQGR
jgi:hypothetical protein